MGKKSQEQILGKLIQYKNKFMELGLDVTITPSPIRCEGSPKHPNCRLPITLSGKQVESRNKILKTFLEDSKNCINKCSLSINDFPDKKVGNKCPKCGGKLIFDEEDRTIGLGFIGQCYMCICEHPEIKRYLDSRVFWAMMKSRPIIEKQYGSGV